LSINHVVYYGLGAYATAILMKFYNFSFEASVLCGIIISVIIACLLTFALKKVQNEYYALASIGLSIIFASLLMNLGDITKGAFGIFGITRPEIFGFTFNTNLSFLILSLIVSGVCSAILFSLKHTHFLRVLHAIREDEVAVKAFGYNVEYYKIFVFVLGAIFASISGSLYATYISFIDPTSFTLNESIFVLTIIIFGGLASTRGAIFGVIILTILPEFLRFVGLPNEIAAQTRIILYSLALVYLMYKKPTGLFGKYSL